MNSRTILSLLQLLNKDPAILHDDRLGFFRQYLISLGAKIPPKPEPAPAAEPPKATPPPKAQPAPAPTPTPAPKAEPEVAPEPEESEAPDTDLWALDDRPLPLMA